jgi:hypothetical protein
MSQNEVVKRLVAINITSKISNKQDCIGVGVGCQDPSPCPFFTKISLPSTKTISKRLNACWGRVQTVYRQGTMSNKQNIPKEGTKYK